MKRLDTAELTALSNEDLTKRLNDLRSELSKMRSKAARGTLKKELGEIKTLRRNIARMLTVINSKTRTIVEAGSTSKKKAGPIEVASRVPEN